MFNRNNEPLIELFESTFKDDNTKNINEFKTGFDVLMQIDSVDQDETKINKILKSFPNMKSLYERSTKIKTYFLKVYC